MVATLLGYIVGPICRNSSRAANAALGRPLPPVVGDVYRIHSGLRLPAEIRGVSQAAPLLSLDDSLAEHHFMCEALANDDLSLRKINASPGVQGAYWLRGWLPIATGTNYSWTLPLMGEPGRSACCDRTSS
jgi:hypothetical protein